MYDWNRDREDLPDSPQPQDILPDWMQQNLEGKQPQQLPDWVKQNLEGVESREGTQRSLETHTAFGGIIREFFRGPMEASQVSKDRYDIAEATEGWHLQTETYSCANACQEFIIDEYLGIDVREQDLNNFARENNWYQEDGTYFSDIGNLLEAFGIQTHRYENASFAHIKAALDNGDRVIVAVHNAALDESWWDIIPVVSANHAVEVIGVDDSDPRNVKVIVNDPGVPDGRGKVVSLDTFNQARDGSGGFMMVAERP